jgi:hypothetical protein
MKENIYTKGREKYHLCSFQSTVAVAVASLNNIFTIQNQPSHICLRTAHAIPSPSLCTDISLDHAVFSGYI